MYRRFTNVIIGADHAGAELALKIKAYLESNPVLPFVDYNDTPLDSIKKGDYLILNPERQLWFEKNVNVTLTYTKANYQIASYVFHPEQNGFVLIRENETDRLYRYVGK